MNEREDWRTIEEKNDQNNEGKNTRIMKEQ